LTSHEGNAEQFLTTPASIMESGFLLWTGHFNRQQDWKYFTYGTERDKV